jgi:hypothetical protein
MVTTIILLYIPLTPWTLLRGLLDQLSASIFFRFLDSIIGSTAFLSEYNQLFKLVSALTYSRIQRKSPFCAMESDA